METNWYTSPEEVTGAPSSWASDIYRLGVLLFELYCIFSSAEEKCGTKEASFCLWLLHPQPTSCPSSSMQFSELLQSEFLNEPRDDLEERRVVTDLKEKIEEQELSLEFLLLMQQRKQETTDKLCEMVSFISSDIDEVKKLQSVIESKGRSSSKKNPSDSTLCASSIENDDFGCLNSRKRSRPESHNYTAEVVDGAIDDYQNSEAPIEKQDKMISRSTRDGEFFLTAGVNKKIKVFEYDTILDGGHDIHYPVVEMSSKLKLSSICWNGYIKSQIASSNFDGIVQAWDVARNQVFTEMKEHEKRVWSVDYSVADPTLLASGSDDGSVKLWNINQGASAATIRTKANVCCVQFPSDSSNFLAFGSADHNIKKKKIWCLHL
ncbi:hypothetical protein POM88_034670 [Heracleum sosnowskyi]|uniref:Uncharacterized protein n=1 Tax=Heracleum sosnowskyi TaxID=360622 RepID=A0AAD8HLM6_9APIA|nr:hypothetical protein POM88_034670 [Heracleum sosnowskyi]